MVHTLVRGLLTALLMAFPVSAGVVVATAGPAAACSCRPSTLEEQTRRADVVFAGRVEEVTTVDGSFEYAVTATRAFKGQVERQTAVASAKGTSSCGLGRLDTGTDYLFLARGDAAPYRTTTCDGSAPVSAARTTRIERLLGDGTPVEPPPPPTAQRTLVEDSAPASFERLAAPGAAAVLVGLLGLVVVGLRSRRR
jgi:hypothetical protein